METDSNEQFGGIGVELSASVLRAVHLAADGSVASELITPLVRGNDTEPQVITFVSDVLKRFGTVDRIGFTVPGLIDRVNRRIAFSSCFPEHQETDFFTRIEAACGVSLAIENDANAAAYGEFVVGAGRGSGKMFFVTLSGGVGGALIADGRIWHGANGFAGEFGYLAIDDEGRRLEDVASATSIVRRTRSRFLQDSTSSLGGLPEGEITVADVVREAHEGDDFAHLMLQRTGRHVGTALAGVINLLNVDKIVISGEVVAGDTTVMQSIIDRARELSFKPSFEAADIVAGELGSQATAIGAALLAARRDLI